MRTAESVKLVKCNSPVVAEVYSTRQIPTLNGSNLPMNVYIPREEGDLLYSLVRHLRAQLTVEIGMANGLSTLFMAEALRDNGSGRHIAIDPYQHSDWHGAAIALIRKAGLESLVELMELPSHQALPDLERRGTQADFIFIDGSHLFDYVLTDFLCADRILKVGGLLAFDDSDWPAITQVIRYILANRHYEVALPETVIELARYTSTFGSRMLRRMSGWVPKLRGKLKDDFVKPSYELGIRGRCVVLRKVGIDDRNSQTKFHHEF